MPVWPSSPATPDSALSNLLTSSICETPIFWTWSSCRSIDALVQEGSGIPFFIVQPNSTLVSMPMTTASLPWLMTCRAWNGLVTMRYQPLPGPPYCASM